MTPPGDTVSLLQQYTDMAGKVQTTYICSGFGGTDVINVRGTLPTDRASALVSVTVRDLIELGASARYKLVGWTNQHPRNHFGTNSTVDNLKMLADSAYEQFSWVLQYNDISLIFGGPFDCSTDHVWDTPHQHHRAGRNVDMRVVSTSGDTINQDGWFRRFVEKVLMGSVVEEDTSSANRHFHLTF